MVTSDAKAVTFIADHMQVAHAHFLCTDVSSPSHQA